MMCAISGEEHSRKVTCACLHQLTKAWVVRLKYTLWNCISHVKKMCTDGVIEASRQLADVIDLAKHHDFLVCIHRLRGSDDAVPRHPAALASPCRSSIQPEIDANEILRSTLVRTPHIVCGAPLAEPQPDEKPLQDKRSNGCG